MPCFSEVSEVSEPSSWGRSFSFEEASDFGRGAGGVVGEGGSGNNDMFDRFTVLERVQNA